MRYEETGNEVGKLFLSVQKKYFPELNNVNFELVFDTKKRIKNGKFVFAQIKKADDLIQYFSTHDVDYVIFLDKNIWDAISEEDKIRIVRHELRHVFIDARTEDVKYKIRPHDFEDFRAEVILNKDDPDWAERVALVAESLYDKDKEEE